MAFSRVTNSHYFTPGQRNNTAMLFQLFYFFSITSCITLYHFTSYVQYTQLHRWCKIKKLTYTSCMGIFPSNNLPLGSALPSQLVLGSLCVQTEQCNIRWCHIEGGRDRPSQIHKDSLIPSDTLSAKNITYCGITILFYIYNRSRLYTKNQTRNYLA